jgi:predicted dehydrogenase
VTGADRPLRVVVAGTGAHGARWLRTVAATGDVQLAGIVDTDVRRAVAARDRFAPGAPAGADLDAVLRAARPDALIDVTPPQAHHRVTLAALAAGVPVLGEKPMAATLAEGLQLVAAARRHGRLFMVSQSYRYSPGLVDLRRRVGRLGRVGTVSVELFRAVRPGGFRETMAHPFLVEMAVHLFDSARFLLGADPLTAYCDEYRPAWSWYAGADSAVAVFEMTGGVRVVCQGSWTTEGAQTPWDGRWLVTGERGTATWDGESTPTDLLAAALREFVTALRTGTAPPSDCADNLMSLVMVHAAVESARTGRRVDIAELLHRAETEVLAS